MEAREGENYRNPNDGELLVSDADKLGWGHGRGW
jgi:hypothetical protein